MDYRRDAPRLVHDSFTVNLRLHGKTHLYGVTVGKGREIHDEAQTRLENRRWASSSGSPSKGHSYSVHVTYCRISFIFS